MFNNILAESFPTASYKRWALKEAVTQQILHANVYCLHQILKGTHEPKTL